MTVRDDTSDDDDDDDGALDPSAAASLLADLTDLVGMVSSAQQGAMQIHQGLQAIQSASARQAGDGAAVVLDELRAMQDTLTNAHSLATLGDFETSIAQLESFVFGDDGGGGGSAPPGGMSRHEIDAAFPSMPAIEKKECAICLETIRGPCRELRCMHAFCEACIDAWLHKHAVCPLCKAVQVQTV